MTVPEFTTEELEREEWRIINICPLYAISNLGRVRRAVASYRDPKHYVLKQASRNRYMHVNLYNGERYIIGRVHRLVALHFLEPGRPDQDCVNHKDGNPSNNRVENLEWVTRSENALHAVHVLKAMPIGGDVTGAILTVEQVLEAYRLHADGWTCKDIAVKNGVGCNTMEAVLKGRSWAWLHKIHGGPFRRDQVRGHRVANATITDDIVRSIRSRFAAGETQTQIARSLGIGVQRIHMIVKRRAWKHVI